MPGIQVLVRLDLHDQNRPISFTHELAPRRLTEKSLLFTQRGNFKSDVISIQIRDIFQLFSVDIKVPAKLQVLVSPRETEQDPLKTVFQNSGIELSEKREQKSSEERYDTRKYYPGDDIRHLNWKQFSHTGELFIRISNEIYPPAGMLFLCIDCSLDAAEKKTAVFHQVYEEYLSAVYTFCKRSLNEGKQLKIRGSNSSTFETVETLKSLNDFFANLPLSCSFFPQTDILKRELLFTLNLRSPFLNEQKGTQTSIYVKQYFTQEYKECSLLEQLLFEQSERNKVLKYNYLIQKIQRDNDKEKRMFPNVTFF